MHQIDAIHRSEEQTQRVERHPRQLGGGRGENVNSVRAGEDGGDGVPAHLTHDHRERWSVSLAVFQYRKYHRVLVKKKQNGREDEDRKRGAIGQLIAQHHAREKGRERGDVPDDWHPSDRLCLEFSVLVSARDTAEIFRTTATSGGKER